jgi:PilZ domain
MVVERRKGERVTFERGIVAHMMGIDGTWRRNCTMEDVSETGAKLTVEGSVEGLNLKEFFLLLSSTGLAYRRCELSWVNGDQIGVTFLKQGDRKKKAARRGAGRGSLIPPASRSHKRHVGRLWRERSIRRANCRDMVCAKKHNGPRSF